MLNTLGLDAKNRRCKDVSKGTCMLEFNTLSI